MLIHTTRASVTMKLVDKWQWLLIASAATGLSLGLRGTEQKSHGVRKPMQK